MQVLEQFLPQMWSTLCRDEIFRRLDAGSAAVLRLVKCSEDAGAPDSSRPWYPDGKIEDLPEYRVFGRFFALQIGHAAFLAQRIEMNWCKKQTLSDGRQAAFGVGGRRYLLIPFRCRIPRRCQNRQMFQQLQSDFRFQKRGVDRQNKRLVFIHHGDRKIRRTSGRRSCTDRQFL